MEDDIILVAAGGIVALLAGVFLRTPFDRNPAVSAGLLVVVFVVSKYCANPPGVIACSVFGFLVGATWRAFMPPSFREEM
jgi:hypothetical protein